MNVLRFQVGASLAAQFYAIEDPPESWVDGEFGVLRCMQCDRNLHIVWDNPQYGVATCGCTPLESHFVEQVKNQ
jgi:hypothetical protein